MKQALKKVCRKTDMPVTSAGKGYIFADSNKRRRIRNVLGLGGGADREGLLEKLRINYQPMCT